MRRILSGFIMTGKAGGVDRYLLNFLEANQGQDVRIDFLTNKKDKELEQYLEKKGSKLYEVTTLRHPKKQAEQIREIIEHGQYDMTYFNISTAIECVAARVAYKLQVPSRVIHSHSSGIDKENFLARMLYTILHKFGKSVLHNYGTTWLACSKKAGYFMYPKKVVESQKFQVVYNAVDRNRFIYDEGLRMRMQRKFEVEDKLVIGHFGNYLYAKNYPFLLDVFEALYDREPDAVLFLIGEGPEKECMIREVEKRGIKEAVYFLSWQEDTNAFYQMFDILLLPSRFEGLPIVGVEAQSTKLSCLLSDSITPEAQITDHCFFMSLQKSPVLWAKKLQDMSDYVREDIQFLEEAKYYDLNEQKEQLKEISWL